MNTNAYFCALKNTIYPVKQLTLAILAVLTAFARADASEATDVTFWLDSLDAVLADSHRYNTAKEEHITSIKTRLAGSGDPEQRYWVLRDLYRQYSSYDSDSALLYSSLAAAIASDCDRRDWLDEIYLDRAYILSATGMLTEAAAAVKAVEPTRLSDRMYIQYCETSIFVQTHLDQYLGTTDEELPYSRATFDMLTALCSDLPMTDPRYYWFLGYSSITSAEKAAEAIPVLEGYMDGRDFNSRDDARYAWMLSQLYMQTDNRDKRIEWLARSAIADIRTANKEIASLEELSLLLLENGDFEHANNYISYCIQCAIAYKSRVRIAQLADLQYRISNALQERSNHQSGQIVRYIVFLVVILVLLSLTLVLLWLQLRRLKRNRAALHNANSSLKMRVDELQDAREQLHAANESLVSLYASVKEDAHELAQTNEVKEKYIAYVFEICSEYIGKLDDYRKHINRLIMAGRFEQVREFTKSPELSHAEVKELYANFDKIFLSLYPGFIEDFNTLLRPGEKIEPRQGELLNTELRIYALVRLGLSDSTKIAKFLHCSPQTVYNTRLRVRNRSDIPRDEFASRVAALGKSVL